MSALRPDGAIRPFSKSGYEILDDNIERGELVIWSVSPTKPRIGDSLLIESGGRPYDAAVGEVRTFKGGWSATCRAKPLVD
ncbi:MAG TPA: hypothetical protein VLI41_09270 [Phenylobacterium sp.]|uniref:hypothetical protein n=1 Tax=Phenylobacterium sp. TaxID=1871053 RepID=UPI002D10CE3E|nr:hypothetical protein [Phenylobacterium sp.]HSV03383.1 hypothetical protein [Phenylobacterium sp.]